MRGSSIRGGVESDTVVEFCFREVNIYDAEMANRNVGEA